jgi:hypothetical protein
LTALRVSAGVVRPANRIAATSAGAGGYRTSWAKAGLWAHDQCRIYRPKNLKEKLAMEEAMSGHGKLIMDQMGDAPRLNDVYGPGTWRKWQHVHESGGQRITVHQFIRPEDGRFVEPKVVYNAIKH